MASANAVPSIAIMPIVPHHIRLRWPNAHVGSWLTSSATRAAARHDRLSRSVRRRGPPPARAALCPAVGQNQPISATTTGTAPQTTAHGVKIEPMNSDRRRERGQEAARSTAPAIASRMSGSASSTRR